MIFLVSDEPILVILDPTRELSREDLLAALIETRQHHALETLPYTPRTAVRVARSEHHPEGAQALAEDIAAVWFVDFITPDGSDAPTSGHGVRAAAQALTHTGLLNTRDRRDAIPIGTRFGVRDVLLGRTGLAADLGRWRMRAAGRGEAWIVTVAGAEWCVVTTDNLDGWDASTLSQNHQGRIAVIDPSNARTSEGIGRSDTRIFDRGEERRSSGTGAAAAALILRHLLPPDTPHHWAIGFPGGAGFQDGADLRGGAEATLAVRMFPTEEGEHVSISGPVELHAAQGPHRFHGK